MNEEEMELISIDEVAEMLGCGVVTVYRLLKERKIPSFKIGRIWKIPRRGIEEYIMKESGMNMPSNPWKK